VTYAWIVAGAIVGAPLRYFLQGRVQDRFGGVFPWGTFAVNVSGCLVIGVLLTLAEERGALSREARLTLVTGFLGSYTTFSTFGWESYALAQDGDLLRAAANVILSVAVGLVAVWAGAALARLV
jgi:CrcB protein